MRAALTALLLVTPLLPTPLPAQQSAAPTMQQLQQDLGREAGIEMTFRHPHQPVAHLTLKTLDTSELQGHKLIRYTVAVDGPVSKGPYVLMLWDIQTNEPVENFESIQIGANGTLRCVKKSEACPTGPDGEVVISFTGMLGQPRHLVLTGDDKKPAAMGEVVPFPVSGTDQGCSIEASLLRLNGSAVLIIGRGFKPGETVKFESSSYGESSNGDKTADENGQALTIVLPFVKGHDSGKTSIAMTGSRCRPTASFNWGAYKEEPATPEPGK
jgi:hypothetical protein